MNANQKWRRGLNIAAFACFLTALVLVVLLRIFQLDKVVMWYNSYTDTLSKFEARIESNGASWASALFILLNFLIKSIIPWFPFSCICVAVGVVFPWYYALLINIAGMTVTFTVRFFWGKRFGGGNAKKILSKYKKAYNLVNGSHFSSRVVLILLRAFPCLPINATSQLYGTTSISYWKFLLLSLAGFSYKIFLYTLIGRSVYNPFSASFILPFVFLLIFSGVVLLIITGAIGEK